MTFASRDADLEYIVKDCGEPVVLAGSVNTYGKVRRAGTELQQVGAVAIVDDEVEVIVPTFRVNQVAGGGFGTGSALTVSGVAFKVQRRFLLKDGHETSLVCVEVA